MSPPSVIPFPLLPEEVENRRTLLLPIKAMVPPRTVALDTRLRFPGRISGPESIVTLFRTLL